ncbi:MAG TPA: hypothetical protein VLE53_00840 [Gemmatimonadaceae bacterium]|nr:hypothetical protein [Gemmatimonadaceae bacterium]
MTDRRQRRRVAAINGSTDVSTGIAHSFHREHFYATSFFVETARQLEFRGAAAVGDDGIARHRACVTAAIFSAVAFLESSVNELYLEFRDAGHNGASTCPKRAHTRLAHLWPSVRSAPMMRRYQVALQAADAERFDEHRGPYRDVAHLLRLRDALVHYQPERHDERRRHHRLQRQLRDKFAPNTLLRPRALWFPDLCLGSGCAEWALRTAEAFSDDFCGRMAIPSRRRTASEAPDRSHRHAELVPTHPM